MGNETQFGPYVLEDRIAIGGMADIFRARRPGLGGISPTVVIKRLQSHFGDDRQFINMLYDEARLLSQLSHPNIVQIFELGEIDKQFYIAMESVEGWDLFHILRTLQKNNLRVPIDAAVFLTQEVLAGLHYTHSKHDAHGQPLNIIHRDVSPQNVLVSVHGEVKLIDFGIAKASRRRTDTAAGIIKGKLCYMSPEQSRGDTLDPRSDLFSAAIVLYESLTACPMYAEEEHSTALLTKVQRAEIDPITEWRPDVPPDLVAIVNRALAPKPQDRYPTALELHGALSQFLATRQSDYNKLDFAHFVRQILKLGKPDDYRQLFPNEETHAIARQSLAVTVEATTIVPDDGSFARAMGNQSLRSNSAMKHAPMAAHGATASQSHPKIKRAMLVRRRTRIRIALAAVVSACVIVAGAIVFLLSSTPANLP